MGCFYDLSGKRVWVAGHRGMVGAALVRRLARENCHVLTVPRAEVDLTRQAEVEAWMAETRPQAVFLAAAKVGGILANHTQPGPFLYDNLMIGANVMEAVRRVGVEKMVFLGSSCIYPRAAPQPISEDSLLTGPLEPTNQWYALAKIAAVKLCQAYRRQYGCDIIAVMPTNLYGPGDTFDPGSSHVIPALLMKAHRAKVERASSMEVWGTGRPLREFMHVDDLADALVFLMKTYSDETPINVGSGQEVSIQELAEIVAEVVGWTGTFTYDTSKPDGTPRKLLDSSRLFALGWRPTLTLREGLAMTYAHCMDEIAAQVSR